MVASSSSHFFGAAPTVGSRTTSTNNSNIGTADFAEPARTGTSFWYEAPKPSNVLVYDHLNHSGDGGVDYDGGSGDEAANLFRIAEFLGYDVEATDSTSGSELSSLLESTDIFMLPEAEAVYGSDFSDFPDSQLVNDFVAEGGRMVVFGYSGDDKQANFLNSTFGFELVTQGGTTTYLNDDAVEAATDLAIFLGGSDSLGTPSGTSSLLASSLPEAAVAIYESSDNVRTSLAQMPYEEGDIFFYGWDMFGASTGQEGGWYDIYASVLESGPGASSDEPVDTDPNVDIGEGFFAYF